MTGADSPVMADSSTDATPSTTSPSPGMMSPASQTTRSPMRSSVPGTCSSVRRRSSRRATVSVLALRRVSACALPRPSATASARLAKIVVSHSQAAIAQPNQSLGSLSAKTVVSTEPISTTNITGDLTITRGSSLRRASGKDLTSCLGSNRPAADAAARRACARWAHPVRRPGRGGGGHGAGLLVLLCVGGHDASPSASGPSASAGK